MNSINNKIVDPREYDIPEEAIFAVYGVTVEINLNQPQYDKQQNRLSIPNIVGQEPKSSTDCLEKYGLAPPI